MTPLKGLGNCLVGRWLNNGVIRHKKVSAFSQRTINGWNRLPGECVNATSVNMFKNKIDN